jgi:hypothetical protein
MLRDSYLLQVVKDEGDLLGKLVSDELVPQGRSKGV